jgi:uncharacterized protein (TIGR00251 family)
MIVIDSHPDGAIVHVRAQPGSRANRLKGEQDGALKVCVTQVAEKGKANAAIIDVLATSLDLRTSQIVLLSGETSRQKRFLIRGTTVEELRGRLLSMAGES